MPVHCGIRRSRVGMRSFNVRHFAPRRKFRRRHVLPSFPFVLRQLNQPVVRTRPDFPLQHKRWRNRVNHAVAFAFRSEEHTSELQSHSDLVCRLLLEKKKKKKFDTRDTDTQPFYTGNKKKTNKSTNNIICDDDSTDETTKSHIQHAPVSTYSTDAAPT